MLHEHSTDASEQTIDSLTQCRQDIDRIDAVLVALLRERTRVALDAGRIKNADGQGLVAPAREAAVLDRVRRLSLDPLDADATARIFERIIEETRAAQERSAAQ